MAVIEAHRAPTASKRIHTALRIPPSALQHIDQRAQALSLTRTEYMIRTALGEPLSDTDQRLEHLEQRLQRLEELAYGT